MSNRLRGFGKLLKLHQFCPSECLRWHSIRKCNAWRVLDGCRVGVQHEQRFITGSFDAVALNHVIERVEGDLVLTLLEFARILITGSTKYLTD